MFTAWSEIKYLATKELLSLPNSYFLGNLEKLGLLFISPSGHTVYRVASEDDDLLSSVKTANSQRKKIIKILKEQKSGYKKFSRKF